MRVKIWLGVLASLGFCGCNQVGVDQKELHLLRQDLGKFNKDCDKLSTQVQELTKLTHDLREQVAMLREARTAIPSKPLTGPEREVINPADMPRDREASRGAALCDIIETHVAAVEGILSQPDADSVEPLLDDLEAAFTANLKRFANHPHIQEIRQAASAMRKDFLAAAKQSPLAANPYLKNVRQKSLNDARKDARTLRSLCEE